MITTIAKDQTSTAYGLGDEQRVYPSELAAILGFGILRGILRRKSIIENNIVQTIASGVNGASSGMMFSVPAIFILGYGDQFDPVIMTFGCIAGAFLGIAFIIPLRKHMIDFERRPTRRNRHSFARGFATLRGCP